MLASTAQTKILEKRSSPEIDALSSSDSELLRGLSTARRWVVRRGMLEDVQGARKLAD
jgi:hypothetical protein